MPGVWPPRSTRPTALLWQHAAERTDPACACRPISTTWKKKSSARSRWYADTCARASRLRCGTDHRPEKNGFLLRADIASQHAAMVDSSLRATLLERTPLLYSAGASSELDRPAHVRSGSSLHSHGDAFVLVQD